MSCRPIAKTKIIRFGHLRKMAGVSFWCIDMYRGTLNYAPKIKLIEKENP